MEKPAERCQSRHGQKKEKWSKLENGGLTRFRNYRPHPLRDPDSTRHFSEGTKVIGEALAVERIGECLGFLDGTTIDADGALVSNDSAYDKKMRVPLHRVWTAGVNLMEEAGHRNSHK
jgi:hypothetical protein